MVEKIFETIGSVITGFMANVSSAVNGIGALIWTPAESGTGGSLTTFGTLCLLGLGIGIVYWAFGLIRGLLQR